MRGGPRLLCRQRLRELARAESLPQNERTELAPVIADLRSRFPASMIEASDSLDRAVGMSGEKALIVLSHLADNAMRHKAKSIRLEAVNERTTLLLTVSNNGERISAPNRDRIFDAFFTTRRDEGGTGMGLAIARRYGEPWRLDQAQADQRRRCVRAAIPRSLARSRTPKPQRWCRW